MRASYNSDVELTYACQIYTVKLNLTSGSEAETATGTATIDAVPKDPNSDNPEPKREAMPVPISIMPIPVWIIPLASSKLDATSTKKSKSFLSIVLNML